MSDSEAKEEEKPVKPEKVAEDTGKLVGKGLQKAWNVTKSFGKGVINTIDKSEEPKETTTCPHCSASVTPDSNFCASCGKKLVKK